MLVRPCVHCPECPRKEWRTKSFGLKSTPTGKRASVRPRPGGVTTSPTVLCRVCVWKPVEPSEISVAREVFRVLLGLLPPRLSPEEKRARK